MSPEEITRLWQLSMDDAEGMRLGFTTQQHYFAALVAAAEREKVAAWMIQRSYATGHGDTTEDLLKELDWQIHERIAAEREACLNCYSPDDTATDWIDKIRARGQA